MTPEPQLQRCALCGKAGAAPTCAPSALPRLQIVFLEGLGPRLACDDCRESIRLERAMRAAREAAS
jgi:hypothetical protein